MIDRIEISACTSMMVGKKASLDGATYISRNEDRFSRNLSKTFCGSTSCNWPQGNLCIAI